MVAALALTVVPFAKIMVLGTYHFGNPGLDVVKTQIRDTMSAQRQKEISDVVGNLAAFHPTKIAVEATPD